MDAAKLNDWLQVIGLFGVIGSLIFVGLQMMQDRQIALSAVYQERATTATQFYLENASNQTLHTGIAKIADGHSERLSPSELYALRAVALAAKQMADNSFYQFEQGFAPEEHWLQIRGTIKQTLSNPIPREAILGSPMRPSFRAEVEDIVREIESETM